MEKAGGGGMGGYDWSSGRDMDTLSDDFMGDTFGSFYENGTRTNNANPMFNFAPKDQGLAISSNTALMAIGGGMLLALLLLKKKRKK